MGVLVNLKNWVCQEKHCKMAGQGRQFLHRAFLSHPKEAGETYLQHFWFTVKLATWLMGCGLALLLHGLFPFLFTRTTSNQIARIYAIMLKRTPAGRGQVNEDLKNGA